jgi:hypothetical protein
LIGAEKNERSRKRNPNQGAAFFGLFRFFRPTPSGVLSHAAEPNALIEPKRTKEGKKGNPNETSDFSALFVSFGYLLGAVESFIAQAGGAGAC